MPIPASENKRSFVTAMQSETESVAKFWPRLHIINPWYLHWLWMHLGWPTLFIQESLVLVIVMITLKPTHIWWTVPLYGNHHTAHLSALTNNVMKWFSASTNQLPMAILSQRHIYVFMNCFVRYYLSVKSHSSKLKWKKHSQSL